MIITVRGKVFTGLSEGKRYTELSWVKEQMKEELGFEPHPGTLNLFLSSEIRIGSLLSKGKGCKIQPEEGYFPGRFYRALIMGRVPGAVVRPETPKYPEGVIEIVAPVCLRKRFHLKDGDDVEVKIWLE